PMATRDMLGTLNLPLPEPHEKAYRVTCSPELPQPEVQAIYRGRPEMVRDNCKRLPQAVDRAIMRDYALSVLRAAGVAESAAALAKAKALENHVFKSFRFKLAALRTAGTDRVVSFTLLTI